MANFQNRLDQVRGCGSAAEPIDPNPPAVLTTAPTPPEVAAPIAVAWDGHDISLVYPGSEVKALGDGRIGGILAPFATPSNPDPQGDFFTPNTDFWLNVNQRCGVVWHHGLKALGPKLLGVVDMTLGEAGLEGIATLDLGDPDAKAIYERAERGECYWSTGSTSRLTSRRDVGVAREIVRWPIVEASLTDSPVDRRAKAWSIKAIVDGEIEPEQERMPLIDRAKAWVADAEAIADALEDQASHRKADGRVLSREKRDSIKAVIKALSLVSDRYIALDKASEPPPDPAEVKRKELFRRLVAEKHRNLIINAG